MERFEHPVGRGLDEVQPAPFSAPVFLLALPVISARARVCYAVAYNVVKHALLVEASCSFSPPNIGDAQVGLRREGRILGPSLLSGGMMKNTGWDEKDGRRDSDTDEWDNFDDSTRVHRSVTCRYLLWSTTRLLEISSVAG